MTLKATNKIEFGDFQTPESLAEQACFILSKKIFGTIIEPTCGRGTFLIAALKLFSDYEKAYGLEVNKSYLKETEGRIQNSNFKHVNLFHSDFFDFQWNALLEKSSDPLLIIGNPPWVTNSTLGSIESKNLPQKRNFQKTKGINAITGKSNFDISEWMLLQFLLWLNGRNGTLAILCKTSVARKALRFAWQNNLQLKESSIYNIDALKYFGASVDACFLVCEFFPSVKNKECQVYDNLEANTALTSFGYFEEQLIANMETYKKHASLHGKSSHYTWRSGIKHDCSKVMELTQQDSHLINGFGEFVNIEEQFLYPMLKSSDINNGCLPRKRMIVPQMQIGEETSTIQKRAPKTWAYLNFYKDLLDKRKSSIYKNKPPFSVFGIGKYSFSPWKVCISGLYKNLRFTLVGPYEGKPVMCDDTVYFVPCASKEEAEVVYKSLNSDVASEFYNSFIFWDAKRPITADILNQLHLEKLINSLGYQSAALSYPQQLHLV